MRIFVTGAGGFIGSALCRRLEALGHQVAAHVHARDGEVIPSSVPDKTELIVNAAGRLGSAGVDESELTLANATLPDLLAALCETRGIGMVHLSTPGVTGLLADVSETSPLAPWGPYERTKARGEELLRKRLGFPGGSLTILRPDFVYGPGDRHKLELFRMVRRGVVPLVGMHGGRLRPTFVDDVCGAVVASLPGGPLQGGLFNIGGPETVTLRELTSSIARALGRRVVHLPIPRRLLETLARMGRLCPAALSSGRIRLLGTDHYVSVEKARQAGFSPERSVREGVEATCRWYLEQGLLG